MSYDANGIDNTHERVLRQAARRIRTWRRKPWLFATEEMQFTPDRWQLRVLKAFASADENARRIAMKACKGPGKTALLAILIWNFLACYGEIGEHPKGAATSVTKANLDANLWPEIAKWQGRSPFLKAAFKWTKSRVFAVDHPETWFFDARTWAQSADAQAQSETLAGLHAKYLLFVLDESSSIPSAIMATAEAGLANAHEGGWAKIVQAGNPTHLEGPLYEACTTHRDMWTIITITGDPDDPDRSPRISVQWAREQIKMYGRENPWVKVNVFGEFPPASLNALIGVDEVEAAMRRYGKLREQDFKYAQKRLGLDVARFGDDRTILFPRQGLMTKMPVVLRQVRTTVITARALLAKKRWGWELCLIDDTGHWGHGVVDQLIASGEKVVPVIFNDTAIDARYKNRRTEMWLEMAEWIKRGGALPPIPELVAELTSATYTFVGGQFQLEDKDLIKEKLGRSPDLADALALTFALPDMPADDPELPLSLRDVISGGKYIADYEPLEHV